MIDHGKHNVLGVRIDAVDYEAAVQRIMEAALTRRPLAVSALAVHGVMTCVLDATYRYRLSQFDLVLPDGQPVRWALRWLHQARLEQRVYGPQLMLETCRRAADHGLPVFLFGGTQELLRSLVSRLKDQFTQLEIAGIRASKFRRLSVTEKDELVATIRDSGAAITFVGLGCPRQEVWVHEFHGPLSMPLIAVGAAFDFHSGAASQAPPFMQKRGLEWVYRLAREPRRLWKRYLVLNPMYLSMLLLQISKLRDFDPDDGLRPSEEILFG